MSERGSKTPALPGKPDEAREQPVAKNKADEASAESEFHVPPVPNVVETEPYLSRSAASDKRPSIAAPEREKVRVPREPTKEMVKVGEEAWCRHNHGYPYEREIPDIWRTMYDAAPSDQIPKLDAGTVEICAKVCDALAVDLQNEMSHHIDMGWNRTAEDLKHSASASRDCAQAIRALLSASGERG